MPGSDKWTDARTAFFAPGAGVDLIKEVLWWHLSFYDEDNCEIFLILKAVRAREPQSFWREKVVAVVNLLLVLAGMSKWGKQVIKY